MNIFRVVLVLALNVVLTACVTHSCTVTITGENTSGVGPIGVYSSTCQDNTTLLVYKYKGVEHTIIE